MNITIVKWITQAFCASTVAPGPPLYSSECFIIPKGNPWPVSHPCLPNLPAPSNDSATFHPCGFASAGFSSKQNPATRAMLWLTSFHPEPCFQGSSGPRMCRYFISLHCQTILRCMDIPYFIYPPVDGYWAFAHFLSTVNWLVLLWTFMHKFLCRRRFSLLLVTHKRLEQLSHMRTFEEVPEKLFIF